MDLHQLRYALLKVSVVVLAFTSWIFGSFILETAPGLDDGETPVAAGSRTAVASLMRLPASLPEKVLKPGGLLSGPTTKVMDPVRMDTVKLPCWDQPDAASGEGVKIASRWVRLTGKSCAGIGDSGAYTVSNLSNGYVATVFDTKPGLFTTDFIPLRTGQNEILIRFEQGGGASLENRFRLVR